MGDRATLRALGGALVPLGGGAIIAALQAPSIEFHQSLLYAGCLGLLLGLSALAWAFIFPRNKAVAMSRIPTVTASGATVMSVGQQGGVTAGTYINQAVKPEFRVIERKQILNADGTCDTVVRGEVVAQFSPGNLHIEITAVDILDVKIMPPPVGGVASITLRNVLRSPEFYAADIPAPSGIYMIVIKTKARCEINCSADF